MSLTYLKVEDLRCLPRAELTLQPGCNLIWGSNGSGKTSLLESIFLLGRGRSFRTRNTEKLIRNGQNSLVVFGRIDQTAVGVQVSRSEGTIAKVNGSFVNSLAELSHAFPVQVIDPGVHKLVEEGSHRRRRWLDWAVFHVEPQFIDVWTRYTRALKQRNAALKSQPDQAALWDPELARLGEIIAESRRSLIDRLNPYWRDCLQTLVGFTADFQYMRGWAQDVSLADALEAAKERDRVRGITHPGPHRGDVYIRVGGRLAREVLSRGQQKLVAVAMILSQLHLLKALTGTAPTLLLDDPAAELDSARLASFIEEVQRLQCQLVVTSLQAEFPAFGKPDTVFHVEQGEVRSV